MFYTSVFQIHGQLMILVWLVLAPCTILIARHGNKLFKKKKDQIRVHMSINLLMALIGGYAAYLSITASKFHFNSMHQKLGLVIAFLASVQGGMGIAMAGGKQKWLKEWHGILGPIIWILAMGNAMLGSELLGWNATMYLAAYMFLVISLFLYLNVEEGYPAKKKAETLIKRVSARKRIKG